MNSQDYQVACGNGEVVEYCIKHGDQPMRDVGDLIIIDGVEYEVVWAGGEGLTGPRDTKSDGTWERRPRLYTLSGRYKGQFKGKKAVEGVDNLEKKVDYFGDGEE